MGKKKKKKKKKKTDKFLFHKNLTPGTLQRSNFFFFFFRSFHRCSLFPSPRFLNVPRATEQHTVPLEKQSPDVPRLAQSLSFFLSFFSFPPLLSFASSQPLSRLLYSPVPCMCEEHCRRAMVEWGGYRVK